MPAQEPLRPPFITVFIISAAILAIHFYNNAFSTYGIFRDELYYIACSEHLAFGYVDQPPLCAFILRLSRTLFGDSLFALRIVPSLAHACTVLFSGMITSRIGGGRYAQSLAALCVALAPGILGMFGIYSMNAIEIVLWSIIFYLLIRVLETRQPRYWIWIGFLLGIGLMNKISTGWLCAGIAAGLLLTNERQWLKKPQPWIAAVLALTLFLPFVLWNIRNEFAHLEFAANASRFKYASQNPLTFFSGMVLLYNPVAVPVWMSGVWLLFRDRRKYFRVLGSVIVTVLCILLINVHSKTEYFTPAAVLLLCAGAVQIERWLPAAGWKRPARYLYMGAVASFGIIAAPMAVDILPVESYIAYSRSLGIVPPSTEGHRMNDLPQHFADRFGWKELASTVARVYASVPEHDKKNLLIYGQNYGEAGAIDFYGREFGLPKALSGHNNYWLWGREAITDSFHVVIIIGGEAEDHLDTFEEVTLAGYHRSPYAMEYESDLSIFICRKPKAAMKDVWPLTRRYL